jgi:hypothetical protein
MGRMGPVVLVDLPAEQASSPRVPAMLAACTAALRHGECVLSNGGERADARAIAVVTWRDAAQLDVWIEVGARREGQAIWTSRKLDFRPEDAPEEQWRSIGFAIAGLAGALDPALPEPAPASIPRPEPPSTVVAHDTATPKTARPLPFRLGGRIEIGPGLDRGAWRVGGVAALQYDLPGQLISVVATAGDAEATGATQSVDMNWARFGLGLAISTPLPAGAEGSAGVLFGLERVAATESDASGTSEAKSRWLGGAILDVSVRWPRSSPVGAVLGGQLVRLSGGTAVRSHGEQVASSPATETALLAGLDVRL